MSYEIKLDIFEGPLDLLLFLIKKDEINIYDIPISYITDQYMEYLNVMEMLDINIAGEYIVMAATLMQIKSKMLLPKPEAIDEDIDDPRQELVNQLLQYEALKHVSVRLREMEQERQEWFSRANMPEVDEAFEDVDIKLENNVFELLTAFSKAVKHMPKQIVHEIIIDEFTVEEKIHELLHLMVERKYVRVNALFKRARDRFELVAIFLAVLELVRLGEVAVKQDGIFGDIELYRNEKVLLS